MIDRETSVQTAVQEHVAMQLKNTSYEVIYTEQQMYMITMDERLDTDT